LYSDIVADVHLRLEDLVNLAEEIKAVLATEGEPMALRLVADFIAQFDRASEPDRRAMLAEEPPTTGSEQWDALLAGVAELLANRARLSTPRWAMQPERFLLRWWFLPSYRSLHASLLVEAPAELANRGVFLDRASLESV
jgi:hypothetical protein